VPSAARKRPWTSALLALAVSVSREVIDGICVAALDTEVGPIPALGADCMTMQCRRALRMMVARVLIAGVA
jgi:hypothetical protein